MNWRFCPRCETQLDDETGICPACRWDPLDVQPEPERQPTSLVERYRGTEYDSHLLAEATMRSRAASTGPRGRTYLMVGLLVVLALYSALIGWSMTQDGVDRPATRANIGTQR